MFFIKWQIFPKKQKNKKIIFIKNNSKSLEKKISIFLKKYFFFHKCCKNTKIVSGYAYFTPKLFEMCVKRMLWGLVCACRWKTKTNFESFSVSQNLVIFQKKHKKRQIFATFFLTPPFFRPETDKLPKKSHRPSQMTKMLTKKILVHWNRNWRKQSTI